MSATPISGMSLNLSPEALAREQRIKQLQAMARTGASASAIMSFASNTDWEKALHLWWTQDPAMNRLKDKVRALCLHNKQYPVMITGPTGTGKEVIARAFEKAGSPFVAVNCGGLTETLFQSIFFGHKKGSFTGANEDRNGLLAQAADGVIFLDEIAEMPMHLQATLLRAIQQNEIYQVGSVTPTPIRCRFIAATKRPLEQDVDEGKFRDDLFSRLRTFEFRITGLQDRPDDINYIAKNAFQWHEPITNENALRDIHKFNVRGIDAYIARMKVYGTYE